MPAPNPAGTRRAPRARLRLCRSCRAALVLAVTLAVPFALPLAARAAGAGFTTFDNPGGGRLISGTLPAADATTAAALTDMLRRTHRYFAARPDVTRLLVTPDGATALAFFAENSAQGPVWGIVLASAAPGRPPRGALLFDLAPRFPTTMRPLLARLGAGGPAAVPLTRQVFADNSGSIGVPAGWTLKQSGGGRFLLVGPHGELLLSGGSFTALVPGSFMDQSTRQLRAAGYPPVMTYAHAAYDPDPLRAALAVDSSLQRQKGKPPPRILRVIADRVLGQLAGSTIAYLELVEDRSNGKGPVHFAGQLMITPPAPQGEWFVAYLLAAEVPQPEARAITPTLLAIVRSLKLNQRVLDAQRRAQQRWFDSFEKTMQRREDAQSASVAAFDRVIRGASVVANTATGRHYEAPSDLAGAIVNADPGGFHLVPLSQYIKGVDY